jgi:hypothetical protein
MPANASLDGSGGHSAFLQVDDHGPKDRQEIRRKNPSDHASITLRRLIDRQVGELLEGLAFLRPSDQIAAFLLGPDDDLTQLILERGRSIAQNFLLSIILGSFIGLGDRILAQVIFDQRFDESELADVFQPFEKPWRGIDLEALRPTPAIPADSAAE